MIVANKFQTGFDQPLLAGMFLDKPVVDRNAVQTLSRLNRCHEGKDRVVVVDFTNNAKAILKAFVKYRKGTPFEPEGRTASRSCMPSWLQGLHAKDAAGREALATVRCRLLSSPCCIASGKLAAPGTTDSFNFTHFVKSPLS
jgi:hypothetical protein